MHARTGTALVFAVAGLGGGACIERPANAPAARGGTGPRDGASPASARAEPSEGSAPPAMGSGGGPAYALRAPAAGVPALMSVQRYLARRIRRPITIDGKLDEPAWKAAPATKVFLDTGARRLDEVSTEARLLWDDRNLYLALRSADTDVSAASPRAPAPGQGDAVEILIHDRGSGTSHLVVHVAPDGTILETSTPSRRTGGRAGVVRAAVHVDGTLDRHEDRDRGWTVEMAVPLAALMAVAQPPGKRRIAWGDMWSLNLFRVDATPGRPPVELAWSQLFPHDPHALDQSGDVVFADEEGEDPSSAAEAQEEARERSRDRRPPPAR
jgi:Carbohydrate family 9 binding domain-like